MKRIRRWDSRPFHRHWFFFIVDIFGKDGDKTVVFGSKRVYDLIHIANGCLIWYGFGPTLPSYFHDGRHVDNVAQTGTKS